jgi:hypothetical protein
MVRRVRRLCLRLVDTRGRSWRRVLLRIRSLSLTASGGGGGGRIRLLRILHVAVRRGGRGGRFNACGGSGGGGGGGDCPNRRSPAHIQHFVGVHEHLSAGLGHLNVRTSIVDE